MAWVDFIEENTGADRGRHVAAQREENSARAGDGMAAPGNG